MLAFATVGLRAEPPVILNDSAKFLGATSCASSGCHGGGGQNQNQFHVWSLKDFHSQRPFATLTTARSKQISDALQIKDPAADNRCTSCHAPLASVPDAQRGATFKLSEGVSCESCHGPAENWLRAHTRTDWTHADRTFAGMRDLKNIYVRANNCVACHQTVEAPLLKAGHPELIFELDGQSVAQPKHWRDGTNASGAQAWLVGQAVALRELSWQIGREQSVDDNLKNRWLALYWLMKKVRPVFGLGETESVPVAGATIQNAQWVQNWSDADAKYYAGLIWSDDFTRKALSMLAGCSESFRDASAPPSLQARRAERLVLALDRLLGRVNPPPPATANAKLNDLFRRAQSIPDFDPAAFAKALDEFAKAVSRGHDGSPQ